MSEVSTKPYLLRGIYEWCMDQGYTPYIVVVVDAHTTVPVAYVRDGQIVLNIGPDASHQLQMGNDLITFQARFGGVAQSLSVPVDNVAAIYARENGQGMGFEVHLAEAGEDDMATSAAPELVPAAEASQAPSGDAAEPPARPAGRGGHLKVIK